MSKQTIKNSDETALTGLFGGGVREVSAQFDPPAGTDAHGNVLHGLRSH